MDLFEILSTEISQTKPESRLIKEEIVFLSKKHNVNMPDAFAEELASLFMDPPPWSPWVN